VTAHERQGTGLLFCLAGYNGSFKLSVQPGAGSYQIRLVFESEARWLGRHEWTLIVAG